MAEVEETGVESEALDTPIEDAVVPKVEEVVEEQPVDPVEKIARDIGWTPKDEFKGNPEAWKPADEFIRTGRDVQRSLAKDVKSLKSTMDNMARTSAALMQQQLADRDAYWAAQHKAAVDEGDYEAVSNAEQQRAAIKQEYNRVAPPQTIPNEAAEFAERNSSWFRTQGSSKGDPLATRRAIEIAQIYADNGAPVAEQLAAAERQIKKEFPELFPTAKQPPAVNGNASRVAASSGRAKGFHDMPTEAQAAAKDMVERGVIPDTASYVTQYFASKR